MTHVRQSLRSAVVAAVTGLTTTGSRVYTAKVYPAQDGELPCLVVNTVAEAVTQQDIGLPGIIERRVTVEVVGMVKATSGMANTLDTIAEEVETAVGSGVSVSGANIELAYEGSDIQFSGDTDQPVGTISLRFAATLYSLSSAPGTLVQV
jgi:alpha-L-arabinofuranosidase